MAGFRNKLSSLNYFKVLCVLVYDGETFGINQVVVKSHERYNDYDVVLQLRVSPAFTEKGLFNLSIP